ncbi:MAG: hypothetical protein GYA85_02410 [Propionibacterium sp.]|nr:hypothetical protein [Propionibacterium sp.]
MGRTAAPRGMMLDMSLMDTTDSFGLAAKDALRAPSSVCVSSPHTWQ